MTMPNAIYDVLNADPELGVNLGWWDFGTGTREPAIFTAEPIPDTAPFPVVVIRQVSSVPWSSRTTVLGQIVSGVVELWGNKLQTDAGLANVSYMIQRLLNQATLTIEGYQDLGIDVSAPAKIEDELGFPGYEMAWAARIAEQ